MKIELKESYKSDFRKWASKRSHIMTDKHPDFEIGQKIQFNGGLNNDIRYTTKIIGFGIDEEIYVNWDCYWFPIKNTPKRNIKIL